MSEKELTAEQAVRLHRFLVHLSITGEQDKYEKDPLGYCLSWRLTPDEMEILRRPNENQTKLERALSLYENQKMRWNFRNW